MSGQKAKRAAKKRAAKNPISGGSEKGSVDRVVLVAHRN